MSRTKVVQALSALHGDLVRDGGAAISTMRNYRFCIVAYDPHDEAELRDEFGRLERRLQDAGWMVLTLSLGALLVRRLRDRLDPALVDSIVAREERVWKRDPQHGAARALDYLIESISPHVEGADGLAADVRAQIAAFVEQHPDKADRLVVFLGDTAGLYPFLRTSALLKHIDGHTKNVPVVLLYPGLRKGDHGLSFMGVFPPDTDYRPRIYGQPT